MLLSDATWDVINKVRANVERAAPTSVEEAAQHFAVTFRDSFSSVVLARVFLVLPFGDLGPKEQTFARSMIPDASLTNRAPVLTLLGTAGREDDWNFRERSAGHLALPLRKEIVAQAPMIAKLLADLDLSHADLDDRFAVTTSRMLGSSNGKFFVRDASTAVDSVGRFVIPNRDFVQRHNIKTVFGMGGSYFDGTLAVTIFFTAEPIETPVADRYASFISTFKTVTTKLHQQRKIFVSRP